MANRPVSREKRNTGTGAGIAKRPNVSGAPSRPVSREKHITGNAAPGSVTKHEGWIGQHYPVQGGNGTREDRSHKGRKGKF